MVEGDLMTALDWRPKKGKKPGRYSYRDGSTWYVVQSGPGFSNTFRVTEHDDAGLKWLQKIERKGDSSAKDRTI